MRKVQFTAFALSVLVAVVGCGRTATNEPKKLDKLVTDEPAEPVEPAEPLPPAQPIAETPAPAKVAPVEQAAFAEAAADEAAADEAAEPATVPPVLLSSRHAALCRVKVGDTMPEIELPKLLGGDAKLSALYGKAATVVVFWKADRQMALDELADLGPDVIQKFGTRGVDVVGIAVNQPAADARSTIQKTAANFPQLLDADGKAFDKVG